MNYRFVVRQLGLLLVALAGLLALLGLWSAWLEYVWQEGREAGSAGAFFASAGVGFAAGVLAWAAGRGCRPSLERREAMLLVTMSWLVGAGLSALPYAFWSRLSGSDVAARAVLGSLVNCYFEAMSGLTTAGATVLVELEQMPRSLLLWRAATQWIGGLGIVVLFVAILPSIGVVGKRLFVAEAGETRQGVRPEVRQTARVLWIIYTALTGAEVVALRVAGLSWFDAVCHAFTTLSTGGFSTTDASVGEYPAGAQWVVMMFMVAGGVNFGLYNQLVRRRWREVLRDPELRVYGCLLVAVTLLMVAMLWGRPLTVTTGETAPPAVEGTIRHAMFTAISAQTTTGYATTDFDQWPMLLKGAIVLLMFCGGCAGSTAGGIKVIRIWIALRVLAAELERAYRPQVVRPLRVGGTVLGSDAARAVLVYVVMMVLVWVAGTGVILALEAGREVTFETGGSAVIAVFSTFGPGLGRVGPVETYAWMGAPAKVVLCVLMLLGRLEMYPVMALCTRRFWRE